MFRPICVLSTDRLPAKVKDYSAASPTWRDVPSDRLFCSSLAGGFSRCGSPLAIAALFFFFFLMMNRVYFLLAACVGTQLRP